jgi:murein L,D-transpeptidase YcbB/YkuD
MASGLLTIPFLMACGGPSQDVRDRITTSVAVDAPAVTVGDGHDSELAADVRSFYQARDGEPLWVNGRGLNARGRDALATLREAGSEGLNPERYAVTVIQSLADSAAAGKGAVRSDRLRDLELLLTSRYLLHLRDLAAGAVEPRALALDSVWHRTRLESIAAGEAPAEAATSLVPVTSHYAGLRDAVARYQAIADEGGWIQIPEGEGEAAIAALRARLIAEGDERERSLASRGTSTSGTFDADLKEAVRHAQARHSIEVTGELDRATRLALNVPVEDRITALRLSMDRWRALPREFGDLHVFVNIPTYELHVVENETPILDMRVVVGRDVNPTPSMADTMEYIVVNPYWNVPESILLEEILPKVREDRGYLAKQNMEVVERSGDEPRVIDVRSVDWDADEFEYSVRQRPGPGNALGRVKFMFPNEENIYLHDTPADALFDEVHRAFSHGCVRVEKPMELAKLVLEKATDVAPADLEGMLAEGSEKHIKLDRVIPIYLAYLTAWIDDDRGVRFVPDLYDKDASVMELARARLVPGAPHDEGRIARS